MTKEIPMTKSQMIPATFVISEMVIRNFPSACAISHLCHLSTMGYGNGPLDAARAIDFSTLAMQLITDK